MDYQQSVLQYNKPEDDGRLLDKVIAKFQEDFHLYINDMLLWKDVARNCYVSQLVELGFFFGCTKW